MAEFGGGSLSGRRCWALFQSFFFTCLIRSPQSRQVHLGSFPWSSALKKILTSLPGLQQWVVVGCKPGCRLVGAAQHIWPWLLLLSSFCSPTIPWERPACSLWFCSTDKALFIHAEKESELIWATGWERSYGLMPVELPSHTAAPLHPGHRDHRGQASKWETHHSCGSMYTRIHFWRQREWALGLDLAKGEMWKLISRLMWLSNGFIPAHTFKVKCNRWIWIWILNSQHLQCLQLFRLGFNCNSSPFYVIFWKWHLW